jgi:hypothetical protein
MDDAVNRLNGLPHAYQIFAKLIGREKNKEKDLQPAN